MATLEGSGIELLPGQELLTYLPGVSVTASSALSSAPAGWAADHVLGTAWVSGLHDPDVPAWWEIAFGEPVATDGVYFFAGDVAQWAPIAGDFEALDAGGEVLATVSAAMPTGAGPFWIPLAADGVARLRFTVAIDGAGVGHDQAAEFVIVGESP